MPGHTCSYCPRGFSSSSNRIRHEQLFHKKAMYKEEQFEEEHSDDDDDKEHTTDGESEDEEKESVRWKEIIEYAHSQCDVTAAQASREPYLSEFVEHMKEYAEERNEFVKEMEYDDSYEKIDKIIQKNILKGWSRQESVDVAWHDRRFLVKKIIENNKELLVDEKEESDDDDEDDAVGRSDILRN